MKLIVRETGQPLGEGIRKAGTFLQRFRGLMFSESLPEGSGLHIEPCRSVHSFFMKYPIDVLHLDADGRIVGMQQMLLPGKIGIRCRNTRSVIELPAGTLHQADVRIGQTAVFERP